MDPELFTSPVKSYLLCRICRNVLRNPVLNKNCGDSFCSGCLLLSDGTFNNCPEHPEIAANADCVVPNISREEGLKQLQMRCLYRYEFAQVVMSLAAPTIDSLMPCLARPLRWDDSGCDNEVALGELNNHLSICEHRWVACHNCGASIRAFSLEQHCSTECSALLLLQGDVGFDAQPHELRESADQESDTSSDEQSGLNNAVSSLIRSRLDDNAGFNSATLPVFDASSGHELTRSANNQGPTADQLRTLVACQHRLENIVQNLAVRIAGLGDNIEVRVDKLMQQLTQLKQQQQQQTNVTPLHAASVSRAPSSRITPIERPPNSLNSPSLRSLSSQQRKQSSANSRLHLVVMEPSEYSSSSSSSSDSSPVHSPANPSHAFNSGVSSAVKQQLQPPQLLEPEWTLPFSLNCTGTFCGHSAPVIHLAVAYATTNAATNSSASTPVIYSFSANGEVRVWDTIEERCFATSTWTGVPGAFVTCAAAVTAPIILGGVQERGLLLMANSKGSLAKLSMAETDGRPPRLLGSVADAHSGIPVTGMVIASSANPASLLLFTAAIAEVRVWHLPQLNALQHVTKVQRDVGAMGLTPIGTGLFVACRNRICLFAVKQEPEVLQLVRMPKNVPFGMPRCLLASQRHVIVGTAKKGIWILDSNLSSQLACLGTADLGSVCSLACTSSGNWLLSGQLDGTMQVWDLRTWKRVQKSHWHRERVDCLLLAGNTAYSGSADSVIKVYKYTNQKLTPIVQQVHHLSYFG